MVWFQRQLELTPRSRGFHLITNDVVVALPEIQSLRVGLLHLFLQHTSASLSINENADPDVPYDLENAICEVAPEGSLYRHSSEGSDDMPAHIKSSLLGCGVTVPINDGSLCLGTWQGIYLCEHRNQGGTRKIVATGWGE